jgi:hypothetical protein
VVTPAQQALDELEQIPTKSSPKKPAALPTKPDVSVNPVPPPANRFTSPSVREDLDITQQTLADEVSDQSMSSIASSTFFASAPVGDKRRHYNEAFRHLKQSLAEVTSFFNTINETDEEYAASVQESTADLLEINDMLGNLGRKFGAATMRGPDAAASMTITSRREEELLETYSEKLLERLEAKLLTKLNK